MSHSSTRLDRNQVLNQSIDEASNRVSGSSSGDRRRLMAIVAAFLTVYIVWGSTYLAIRFAVETIPPFMMAGVRFLIAGGVMYAFQFARGQARVTSKQIIACGASGILMLVGGNGLVCWAEQVVPSGITALIIGTSPLWIVVVGWFGFGDDPPDAKVIVGLALGLVGVGLLTRPVQFSPDWTNTYGVVAVLFACFFWAWGSHLSKSPRMPASTLLSVSLQMLISGVVLMAISFCLREHQNLELANVSAKSFWSLAYLIVFGAIIAYTCYGWLFRTVSPAVASTYAYVNPVVAVILGYFLANEEVNQTTIVAAAFILVGVLLVSKRKPAAAKRKKVDAAPTALSR